jgi:hypothetical protein
LIWHSSPNAHKWLASRTPPSEAACKVSFNLHSWVIPPTKGSLQQDVFLVKIFIVNAIWRTSSHACRDMQRNTLPASVAAALGSEVSPTWPPRGPSGNLRALNKLHSLPPSTHRMCFLLTRQPNRASCGCVLVQVRSVAGPRTAWSASRTAKCAAFPAKRRRTAARSQELL